MFEIQANLIPKVQPFVQSAGWRGQSYRWHVFSRPRPKSEPFAQNARCSVQSLNPLLKMQAGASKVWTLCSKCRLEVQSLEPCAQNASWHVQSLNPVLKMLAGEAKVSNPVLKMQAGAPKVWTLCSKCNRRPESRTPCLKPRCFFVIFGPKKCSHPVLTKK